MEKQFKISVPSKEELHGLLNSDPNLFESMLREMLLRYSPKTVFRTNFDKQIDVVLMPILDHEISFKELLYRMNEQQGSPLGFAGAALLFKQYKQSLPTHSVIFCPQSFETLLDTKEMRKIKEPMLPTGVVRPENGSAYVDYLHVPAVDHSLGIGQLRSVGIQAYMAYVSL